ncbi:MAG: DNA replication/repair protein RecF [Chitinophagales bacterium]
MFLSRLRLIQFKNHAQAEFSFKKKINCFIGRNGAGKTNILDAIHYICLTKSFLNSVDQQLMLWGSSFFRLDAAIGMAQNEEQITVKWQMPRRKEFSVNNLPYKKLSEHIGHFPAVVISPDDAALIQGPSEERRRFLDNTLSQIDPVYLNHLIRYVKVLDQRNALLKQAAAGGAFDAVLLEQYDEQLAVHGEPVYEARRKATTELNQLFHTYYQQLSGGREVVDFTYQSDMHQGDLRLLLRGSHKKDLLLERTGTGIHRDDLEFSIGKEKIRKFGSQGQQKSFIIAMKLAQHRLIAQRKGVAPVLLIDDIFDKLDEMRSKALMALLSDPFFEQIFLTDTSQTHIQSALSGKEELYEIFLLL